MRVRHLAVAGLGIVFAMSSTARLHAQRKAVLQNALAPSEAASFDVYLPSQHKAELEKLLTELHNPSSPTYHQWLTPTQFQARFGPSAAQVRSIESELAGFGLTVTETSPRSLHAAGTAAAVEQALGTPLRHGITAKGKAVIVATAPVTAPGSIRDAEGVVTGLSGVVRMHSGAKVQAKPANRYSAVGPYWFDDLKQAYTWPSNASYAGRGATIGVLMSGGYSQSDMDLYFGHEGLASPKISEVAVLGGSPYDPSADGTFEAELDIQQSGGMAPKASIVLYSIPDLSDNSILAGLTQIVTDNNADVVNMSFSGPELSYAPSFNDGVDYTSILRTEDDVMAQGNAQGITFVASSGDSGALSIPPLACFTTTANPCGPMLASVGFPASSPHVTAVGGTNLVTTYSPNDPSSLDSAYVSEEAFEDPLTQDTFYGTNATGVSWGSGGGDSIVFNQPSYQQLVNTGNRKVRTVPDLALHMGGCPVGAASCNPDDSADLEVLGGSLYGVIGTSASSPDFAGLTALNLERWGGRLGNENYYIYSLAAAQAAGLPFTVFHWGIPGFNGLYSSGNNGYNRVLGNGTIYGKDFLVSPLLPSAGVPQSRTNP